MKTQIFVMTHKKFNPPKDTVYVPLQVGSALNPDLGYMKDDTGDSISDLNPYYGELTGCTGYGRIIQMQISLAYVITDVIFSMRTEN